MNAYVALGIAIVFETMATSSLKAAENFTRFWPTVCTVVGYMVSFYFLSVTLQTLSTGIAYAIWSGVGIVLISVAGYVVFGQVLDLPALIGMGLIVAGVVVINVFSASVTH